jgi:uncharacterized protein
MAEDSAAVILQRARLSAGISQSQWASRSSVPQPNISAYEAGVRVPRPETMVKLLDALRDRPSVTLRRHRDQVLDAAQRNRVSNVRVFGSVAHGTDSPNSDVDLLVTPLNGATALDLAGFMVDVQDIVEAPVDVVSDRGQSAFLDRVRREAEPL